MPSEKAKENKTLVAACTACGRVSSTELLRGMLLVEPRHRAIVPVCEDCLQTGWKLSPDRVVSVVS
jgi:hypothetical protein